MLAADADDIDDALVLMAAEAAHREEEQTRREEEPKARERLAELRRQYGAGRPDY